MKLNLPMLLLGLSLFPASGQGLSGPAKGVPPSGDTAALRRKLAAAEMLEAANGDSSVYYYREVLSSATALKDVKGLSKAYRHLFLHYFKEGNYEEAFALAQQEVTVGDKWSSYELRMRGYNNLAIAYQFLNDYQRATDYYLKAAEMAGKAGDGATEAKILDNMASLFLRLKDYPMAYRYGQRSYERSRLRKDTFFMLSGLISMANAEAGLKKNDSALIHLNEADKMAVTIGAPLKIAVASANKALVYMQMEDYPAAYKAFHRTIALAEKNNYPILVATSLAGLAEYEAQRKHYAAAERYAARGIALARKQQLGSELTEMYQNMADIKYRLGKLPEAYRYKDLAERMGDSIMNLQIQTNVNRMNIQYNTQKKDREILQQRLELTEKQAAIRNRNTGLFFFVIVLSALAIILVISRRNHRNRKRLHAQQVLAMQREQEVIRLKALMQGKDEERQRISREMHDDIGSGLTSILFLSNHLDSHATSEQRDTCDKIRANAGQLVGKMNEIIWAMNSDYDTLDDLVAYLRRQASELLDSVGISYYFHVPEAVPSMTLSGEQRRSIQLTMKEALHNVVKHSGAGEVYITFCFGSRFSIEIRDNGRGFVRGQERRFGNGLKNMQQRMTSIGGSFSLNGEGGVTVHISLPMTG